MPLRPAFLVSPATLSAAAGLAAVAAVGARCASGGVAWLCVLVAWLAIAVLLAAARRSDRHWAAAREDLRRLVDLERYLAHRGDPLQEVGRTAHPLQADVLRVAEVLRAQRAAANPQTPREFLSAQKTPQDPPLATVWPQLQRAITSRAEGPLRSLRVVEQLLHDAEGDEDPTQQELRREEYLGVLQRSTDRLEEIWRQFRELARLEQATCREAPEALFWPTVMGQVMTRVSEAAAARSLEVAWRPEDSPGTRIEGYRDVLLGALSEILESGLRNGAPGDRMVVSERATENSVEVSVEIETAAGEAAAGEHARSWRRQAGLVELPLARRILCDLHAGALAQEPRRGGPARWKITLPKASP